MEISLPESNDWLFEIQYSIETCWRTPMINHQQLNALQYEIYLIDNKVDVFLKEFIACFKVFGLAETQEGLNEMLKDRRRILYINTVKEVLNCLFDCNGREAQIIRSYFEDSE